MKVNKPLISICILSYEQPNELDILLRQIKEQYSNKIEVLIKDDSHSESSRLKIKKYSKLYPIKAFFGDKKGIDYAIKFLTINASGKYIWWFGDDFLADKKSISKVLYYIENDETIDFMWLNYRLKNIGKKAVTNDINRYFISKSEPLKIIGPAIGFITSTLISRELALKSLTQADKYLDTLFYNLYIVFYVIDNSRNLFLLDDVIIDCDITSTQEMKSIYNRNGSINNPGTQVFAIHLPNIVDSFNFDEKIKSSFKRISIVNSLKGLIVGWVNNWDSPNGKRLIYLKKINFLSLDFFYVIILFLPKFIVNLFYRIYVKIK